MELPPRSGGPPDVDCLSHQVRATAEKLRKRAEDAAAKHGTQASAAMLASVDQLHQAADLLQLQQSQLQGQTAFKSTPISSSHVSSTILHLMQVGLMLDKKSDEMKAKQAIGPASALATSASHVRTGVEALERIHNWIREHLGDAMIHDMDVIEALEQISQTSVSSADANPPPNPKSLALETEPECNVLDLKADLDEHVAAANTLQLRLDDAIRTAELKDREWAAQVRNLQEQLETANATWETDMAEFDAKVAALQAAHAAECQSLTGAAEAATQQLRTSEAAAQAIELSLRNELAAAEAVVQELSATLQATRDDALATTDEAHTALLDDLRVAVAQRDDATAALAEVTAAHSECQDNFARQSERVAAELEEARAALREAEERHAAVTGAFTIAQDDLAASTKRVAELQRLLESQASDDDAGAVHELTAKLVQAETTVADLAAARDRLERDLADARGALASETAAQQALAEIAEAASAESEATLEEHKAEFAAQLKALEGTLADLVAEKQCLLDQAAAASSDLSAREECHTANMAALQASHDANTARLADALAALEATAKAKADLCAEVQSFGNAADELASVRSEWAAAQTVWEAADAGRIVELHRLEEEVAALEAAAATRGAELETLKAAEQEAVALRRQVDDLKATVAQLRDDCTEREANQADKATAHAALQTAHASATTKLTVLQDEMAILKDEMTALRAERATAQGRILAQARTLMADWKCEKAAVAQLLHDWQTELGIKGDELRARVAAVQEAAAAEDASAQDVAALHAALEQYKARAGAALKKAEKRAALLNPMRAEKEAAEAQAVALQAQVAEEQRRVERALMTVEDLGGRFEGVLAQTSAVTAAKDEVATLQSALATKEAETTALAQDVASAAAQLDGAECMLREKERMIGSLRDDVRALQQTLEAAEALHEAAVAAKAAAVAKAEAARDAILEEAKVGKAAFEAKLAAYDERIACIHRDYAQQKATPELERALAAATADTARLTAEAAEQAACLAELHAARRNEAVRVAELEAALAAAMAAGTPLRPAAQDPATDGQAELGSEEDQTALDAATDRLAVLEAEKTRLQRANEELRASLQRAEAALAVATTTLQAAPVPEPAFGPPSAPRAAVAAPASELDRLRSVVAAHEATIDSLEETLTEKLQQLAALKQPKQLALLESLARVVDEERDALAQRQAWHAAQMDALATKAQGWLEHTRGQFARHEALQSALEARVEPPKAEVATIATDVMEPGLTFKSGVVVKAGAQFTLPVVCSVGTVVEWTFRVDETGGTVDFALQFTGADGLVRQVQPLDRVEKLGGSFTVDAPGTLMFCWDNGFSWLNEKTLDYHVAVLELVDVPTQTRRRLAVAREAAVTALVARHKLLVEEEAVMDELAALEAAAAPLLSELQLCLEECEAHREMVVCPKLEQVQARMEVLKAMIGLYVTEQHTLTESLDQLSALVEEVDQERGDVRTSHSLWANRVETAALVETQLQAARAELHAP
ncbi:hypothetical protein ACHHYP_08203 [Achlya hypogyna]|uniref:GOLD domain-containing protein n=1 Tax=Achlya hypogyna TaxID=1202772 RepID=A0A1V9ZKZ4_ACHHY|nr:hypothetical protein ACHHYP_08203 [Achlya hypogyna]